MKEFLPENKDPLNQISKKALKELGVKSDNQLLYVLQLMLWELQENEERYVHTPVGPAASMERANYYDQLGLVENMLYEEPKLVMRYLQSSPDNPKGEETLFPASSLEKLGPEDLAFQLVHRLYLRMTEDDLGFPTKISQVIFPLT